ncbi:hypothetical protein ACH5RR_007655 [Cinchona calisaya]|uniref:SHSP domain-containing protein n=1 Tax=Cinchona calisaya TaxID=153742 RepID=A0ABD3AF65_9GENT
MNMETTLGAGNRGIAERRSPQNLVFEEIVPPSGWTEDSDFYRLIIDLPGFKMDELKLQVDNYGHLLVSGERQVNEMKHIRFQQSYRMPDNSNIEDTTAKFEDDILYITVPKNAAPADNQENSDEENTAQADDQHVQEENQHNALDKDDEVLDEAKIDNNQNAEEGLSEEGKKEEEEEEFHDAKKENERNERSTSLLRTLRVQLKKNKGIVVTAVLAFSLGVLISQKFQTNHEK